jgi:uncharacterized protein (DUF2249 family)
MESNHFLDVTTIELKFKHQRIFTILDSLTAGESLQILNDHDPKPLYYMISMERHGEFKWSYNESGPEIWRVTITKN